MIYSWLQSSLAFSTVLNIKQNNVCWATGIQGNTALLTVSLRVLTFATYGEVSPVGSLVVQLQSTNVMLNLCKWHHIARHQFSQCQPMNDLQTRRGTWSYLIDTGKQPIDERVLSGGGWKNFIFTGRRIEAIMRLASHSYRLLTK